MTTFLEIIILVVDMISLCISFPGYLFILIVNTLDRIKNKRLDISDQLISGISLFIVSHRIIQVFFDCFLIAREYKSIRRNERFIITFSFMFTVFGTLLFSTWLAIHFCLKIVNINHKLYIHIQRGFPKMFPWIYLASAFATAFVSAPASYRWTQLFVNSTAALQSPKQSILELSAYFTPYIVLSSICFVLLFSSALNIILSLRRHINYVHNNAGEFRTQNIEAHVTAIKKVLSLLLFNLLYYAIQSFVIATHILGQWNRAFPSFYALCHIIGMPILILGSSKIQKKLHSIWLNCFYLDKRLPRNSIA
ncbi:taste receptor type 2 member 7-like [Anomaloglossus baeobatrachus]|uniref:taste receptor type 2 member 7-like n=1 Tax=Anomaloglossus baeobatrachus TaxID=238106 RepID=UPI003F4F6DB7